MTNDYIELGGTINNDFVRKIIVKTSDKDKAFKKYNFVDKYSTIYTYDNKNQDMANIIAPFYIDLDIDNLKDKFETLKKDILLLTRRLVTLFDLTEDNIQYFFSGSKGFHIIIPHEIFGFTPSKDLNDKYKMLAVDLKSYTITKSIDTRIYDSKRLFREPNSINSKTGLYKVQISLQQLKTITYEDLIAYASEPKKICEPIKNYNPKSELAFNNIIKEIKDRQKRTINYKVARQMLEKKEILPCVKYVLQNGAVKGGRNNTAMALASSLFQRNNNKDEIEEIMLTWNNTKLDEPLPERELKTTIQSAFNNVRDGKRYGCGAFIDMGICIKGCPIRKK